jgi:hypothetical protein
MGDAAQVPTQWSGWSGGVAAVTVFVLKQQKVSTGSKRRENLLNCVIMTVLISIGSPLHLTAVSWRCGVDV